MKRIGTRILSLFLAFAMLCTMQSMTAFAQITDTQAPQAEEGKIAKGDIIYLGSYPQSEVKNPTEAIINAEYDENGDAEVEGNKYRRVKEIVRATWEEYLQYAQDHNIELPSGYQDIDTFAACEAAKTEESGSWHYFKWEPIQWKVLDTEGSELFVSAVNVLDAQDYYNTSGYGDTNLQLSWEDSYLRNWLNTEHTGFYQTAFNSTEQSTIVASDSNPGGDKVFLLSQEEVKNAAYGFEDTDDASAGRVMKATAYAGEKSLNIASRNDFTCRYLLRTPSDFPYIKTVTFNGKILSTKKAGDYERPAYYREEYEEQGYANVYGRYYDGCAPAMRIDASSEQIKTLEGIKAQAVEELMAYKSDIVYREAGKAKREAEISTGTANINNAADMDAVNKALADAKAAIDKIKTEEELTRLEKAKEEAIVKLDAYLTADSLQQYSAGNQTKVKDAVKAGKKAVEAAVSEEAVSGALWEAEEKIKEIPTGQVTPEPDTKIYPAIDGSTHGMYSPDKELTIVVYTDVVNCPYTENSLKALSDIGFSSEKVDICCVGAYVGVSQDNQKAELEKLAEKMGFSNITFCYSDKVVTDTTSPYYGYLEATAAMMQYADIYSPGSEIGSPTFVFTDNEGVVQYFKTGAPSPTYSLPPMLEMIEDAGFGRLIPEESKPEYIEAECEVTYGQTNARQMLRRINELRTGENAWEYAWDGSKIVHTDLKELTYDYELEKAAMQRAAELVASFSHTRPNGYSPGSAYSKEFKDALKAENIAIGQGDNFLEEAAFTAWEEENENYAGQGHRRNMLKSSYTSVGVAHVIYKGWHYWVQEFSDKVVGDVKTEADDSPAKVKMSILKYYLNGRELIPVEDSITMKVGEKKPVPEIHLSIKTYGTFNVGYPTSAPALEILEPVEAKWSLNFAQTSWLKVDDDGSLYGLKPGKTDVGIDYNGISGEIAVTVEEADTLTVTFKDGDKVLSTQEVEKGQAAKKPEDPSKEGYTFAGWYGDADCKTEYNFTSAVNENISIYAKFTENAEPEPSKVRVRFRDGYKTLSTQEVEKGQPVARPQDPAKEGYTFAGWYTDADCRTEYNFNSAVNKNISIYAKFTENTEPEPSKVKVTFKDGAGTLLTQEVEKGQPAARPQDPAKEGYTFAGWYVDSACREAYDFARNVTEDLTLYAKFEQNAVVKKVSSIRFTAKKYQIAQGKKLDLGKLCKIAPGDAANKTLQWKTSNSKYAAVNSKGVVTTKKQGAGKKVIITAAAADGSGAKAAVQIQIMKNAVKKISLKAKKSVKAGGNVTIKASVKTNGAKANKKLEWKSSNKKYAAVNSKGKVSAKKAGKGKKVKITASSTDGTKKKAVITISIK